MATSITHFSNKKLKVFISLFLVVLLTLPPVVNMFVLKAHAGTFTNAKMMINNSQAGASGVTYDFRMTATVTTDIKQINIKFCTTPGAYGDACTTPSGMVTTGATRASDNISGTGRTDTFTGNGILQTVITTPATQTPTGLIYNVTGITNSNTTNTSFYARVITYSDTGTTTIDNVSVAAATLDTNSIAMTANIDANFTFTVAAVNSGGTVNSATTTVTTTASTIPFGSLVAGTPSIGAHDISVTTNASNGYTVTASHSANVQGTGAPLISGTTNNIDPFSGTNGTPTTWSEPAGTTANTNTGYFGYTTNDASLCVGTVDRFTSSGGNKWAGSSVTGAEVVCSATGVTAETQRVGWQIEANNIQPGGAYTGTAILIATPTY